MTDPNFPGGWDEERAKRVAAYYESLSEDDQVAEDEAAAHERAGQSVIAVPEELLPVIRQLLAGHQATS